MKSETDQIKKQIELDAPVSRVWRALTDYREFGAWFRVKLNGPFVPGGTTQGQITYPGYEHLKMDVVVETMEPEKRFSFFWKPGAIDPNADNSKEPSTRVEFILKEMPTATFLTLTESGFDALPAEKRDDAFRRNDGGWTAQMENIQNHVKSNP